MSADRKKTKWHNFVLQVCEQIKCDIFIKQVYKNNQFIIHSWGILCDVHS